MTEAPEKKRRIFVAINTPGDWQREFADVQRRFKEQFHQAKIKWTRAEQFHITLRFFGYLASSDLDNLEPILRPTCRGFRPFEFAFTGLGCFPKPGPPRVLWAGVRDNSGVATTLQEVIQEKTAAIGHPPEDREFHPHLTLARVTEIPREVRREWVGAIEAVKVGPLQPWHVNEVLLMESKLGSAGPSYSILQRYPLSAS
jgi:2'-5' RNA ligase